jgi:teichuronic acid biosynthesis glycosyltransferase TuaC
MHVVVITSSFPRFAGDASGHFVLAEVEALVRSGHQVTLLAPGGLLLSVPGVRVVSFGGERAFGWPGIMARLRRRPLRALDLLRATLNARRLLGAIDGVDRPATG